MKKKSHSRSARYLTRSQQKDHRRNAARRRSRKQHPRSARWQTQPAGRVVPAVPTPANPAVTIAAPEVFDLVRYPEEFLAAFDRVEALMRAKKIPRLDFSGTQAVSADAILGLLAIATRLVRKYGVVVQLHWPKDAALAEALEASGLESYLKGTPPTAKDAGVIRRRLSKKVESKTAQELIIFATQTLFGERRREFASFSTFIECMGNTFEHSDKRRQGTELWWASIFCNPETKKAQCTFIDAGIGIFDSVVFKGVVRKLTGGLKKIVSKPEVLRDLFERKIGSRTGESYRNRGMPKIYADAKAGAIQDLVIITDRVYADVTRDDFRTINKPFRGTFYYWEFTT